MRKVYFIDPFLFHVVNRKVFGKSRVNDLSKLVEGVVVEELIRKIEHIGFYHNKKEVDIVFKNFGIEVKWQEKVDFRDFPNVGLKNKILLSKDDFNLKENILIIPTSIFLLLL
jgi:predicted AAA+ superfamily ATPase